MHGGGETEADELYLWSVPSQPEEDTAGQGELRPQHHGAERSRQFLI